MEREVELRQKIDMLVRQLRKDSWSYDQRAKMNEQLDKAVDEYETIAICAYCKNTLKSCTCPF